jgi:hypothetical protein
VYLREKGEGEESDVVGRAEVSEREKRRERESVKKRERGRMCE